MIKKTDRVLVTGQSCYIKKGDWHQIENPCKTPAKIIETWIGDYLDEDDIVRLSDDYGR